MMNTASSIRVWQGFMNQEYRSKQSEFYDLLGSVFMPVTSQVMQPMGMQAYFPGILPYTGQSFPDEVALVVYESQENYYQASRETVIGRAYGKLHGDVFNFQGSANDPASWSTFPEKYTGQPIQEEQCYFFTGAELDWSALSMQCLCFSIYGLEGDGSMDSVESPFVKLCQSLISKEEIKEVIISIGKTYLLVWVCIGVEAGSKELVSSVFSSDDLKFHLVSKPHEVSPIWTVYDPGLSVSPGQLLSLSLKK